ncbi:MAG: hypothetical protein ACE5JM_05975 [Armatimonadota bacterium]
MGVNELVFEAASAALADAGMSRREVDGVCLAASDQLDGRAISSMQLAGPAGGYLRDEVKVGDDGALAIAVGTLRLEAGVSHRVLVVSWTKSTESPPWAAVGVNPEPVYTRPTGLHPLVAEAAVAGSFAQRNGLPLDVFDDLARARAGGPTIEDTLISFPLRTIHLPKPTDAAVALLITTDPAEVELAGLAWGTEHADPMSRREAPESFLGAVARRAYAEAGLEISPDTAVETTDRNVFRLCISVVGLGLVQSREAPATLLEGRLPQVNASGGLWASNPVFAAGLERVAHAAGRVRAGATTAVGHSSYGMAGQGQFVAVLRTAS